MSDPRAGSPGKFIYHQNPPIYTSPSVCQQTNPPRTFTCQPVTDQDHLTWPLHKSAVPPEATSQIGMPMTKVTMARPGQNIGHPPLQVDCHFLEAFGTAWPSIHQQLVYSDLRGTNFWKMDNSTKVASLLGSMIVSTRVTTTSNCFTWIVWPCLPHFASICVIRRGIPFQNIWSQNPLPMEPWKCTSLFTSARCFKSILATSWCPPAADRCKAVHPAACWHRMFCHLTEDLTQKKARDLCTFEIFWGEERYVEGTHFEMQNAWNCLPSYMTWMRISRTMHMKIKCRCLSWCVSETCFDWFVIASCPSCRNP